MYKMRMVNLCLPFCELQLQLEIGTAGGLNSPKLKKVGEFQSYKKHVLQDELIIICHSWSHSHGATTDKLVTQHHPTLSSPAVIVANETRTARGPWASHELSQYTSETKQGDQGDQGDQ